MEKSKLLLNSEKKALWINKKSSREIEGHENKSLKRVTQYPLNYTPKKLHVLVRAWSILMQRCGGTVKAL